MAVLARAARGGEVAALVAEDDIARPGFRTDDGLAAGEAELATVDDRRAGSRQIKLPVAMAAVMSQDMRTSGEMTAPFLSPSSILIMMIMMMMKIIIMMMMMIIMMVMMMMMMIMMMIMMMMMMMMDDFG